METVAHSLPVKEGPNGHLWPGILTSDLRHKSTSIKGLENVQFFPFCRSDFVIIPRVLVDRLGG